LGTSFAELYKADAHEIEKIMAILFMILYYVAKRIIYREAEGI